MIIVSPALEARHWEELKKSKLYDAQFSHRFPRLETVVKRHVKLGMIQVCILPYYLFTGTLIERTDRQFECLQAQYPQVRFGLGHYFGFEAEIYHTLDERVLSLIADQPTQMMECGGCDYRRLAQDHGHQH